MTRVIPVLLVILLTITSYAQQAGPIPGRLLLRLAKEAHTAEVERAISASLPPSMGAVALKPLGEGGRYHLLQVANDQVDPARLEALVKDLPGVEDTEADRYLQYRAQPNDPGYGSQWHLADMLLEPVWNITTGGAMANGQRIAVGIIDSGVEGSHPDLFDNIVFDGTASFDHGTEVAGVVGAVGNNGTGVSGVNWDVDLVCPANTNTLSDAFTQFQFCLNLRTSFNQSGGASGRLVVACTVSWGVAGVDCGFGDPMFDALGGEGVLVVTAGPNDLTDIDVVDDYPATCANPNNIVVTSYGPANEMPFAFGAQTVQFLAPGVDILTTTLGGGTAVVSGNSFAIPNTAGAIALLYSNPCIDFAEFAMSSPVTTSIAVRDALINSVTPVPGAASKCITGGKLNVHQAYQLLTNGCTLNCTDHTITFTPDAGSVAQAALVNGFGTTLVTGSSNVLEACLNNGCFTATFLDGSGDPLSGTYVVEETGGNVIASGSAVDGVVTFTRGAIVPGCTNSSAANYMPGANCDDGSCCTENLARLYLFPEDPDATGSVEVTIVVGGTILHDGPLPIAFDANFQQSLAQFAFCTASGCASITVGSSSVPLAAEAAVEVIGPGVADFLPFTIADGFQGAIGALVELCNGIDDDCDGLVDEDFIWYADNDLDSWGDASTGQVFCTPPVGNFSQQSGDCDDSDPDINPGAPDPCQGADGIDNNCNGQTDEFGAGFWLFDGDGDGYGVEGSGVLSCEQPPNTVLLTGDCDDADPTIHPDAVELCDGIDNDCNGQVDEDFFWYADLDNDGFGDVTTEQFSCTPIPGMINTPGDCNDNDPNLTVFNAPCDDGDPNTTNDVVTVSCTCQGSTSGFCPPGEIEDCNGNCAPIDWIGDGTCDDGSFEWEGNFIFFNCAQFDNDGGDCGSGGCVPELCDGLDNDCDGLVDEDFIMYVDADGDGFGVDGTESVICTPGPGLAFQGGDCDDTDASIFPANGCSACNLSEQTWAADNQQLLMEVYGQCVGECGFGDPSCVSDCMQANGVPIGVICVNCLDTYTICVFDNCSEACGESTAACELCQDQFGCRQAFVSCMGQVDADGDGWWAGSDCDDNDPAIHPLAPELCDGVDNDCDGVVDNGFIWYADADGDGWGGVGAGTVSCTDLGEGFTQQTGDCDDTDPAVHPGAPEVCDGIDNNCDGIIDGIDFDFQSGCTNPMACNYDPNAVCEDGSCDLSTGFITAGTYATDFTATDIDGNTVSLFGLLAQGKTVVLDLFTTWCGPSIAMNNNGFLADWNAHMGPDGLDLMRFVSIEIEDTATATGSLAPFIATSSWPIIANGSAIAQQYAALGMYDNAVPTLIMICPDRSAQVIYPQPIALPQSGFFVYDPVASLQLLNAKCGCRAIACTTNIGCMDPNSCNYDPSVTCPGPCTSAQEWFADNDGDGVGTFSVGTACTQPTGAAPVSGDCNDADPTVQSGFTLFVYTEDENVSGTAHYAITHPGGLLEGDIDMPASNFGIGSVDLCIPGGCMTIFITPNDVPLWPESYLVFNGDFENVIVFATEDGYFQQGVAELCDGLDNDCDGVVDEDFVCNPPEPCTDYILELQSGATAPEAVIYEVLDAAGTTTILSGSNPFPPNSVGTATLCLPDGCYQLRVTDTAGDGLLGYVLREMGTNGRRLIDNRYNMNDGVSQIAGGEVFCVPLGNDRLIYTSCDKLDWKTSPCGGEYVYANDNDLVSAEYGVNDANSGYQMWWFDPNGGYSFKRFQSHATSNGLPASATRACGFKLNSWSGNQLQQGVLYNVKVRGRVNGTSLPWGPACRLMIDNVAAQCPRTKLMDIPSNQFLSCGATRPVATNAYVHARPVRRMNNNCHWINANRYQFRFRIVAENFVLIKTSATNKYWVNTNGLDCGKTYEVDVRASFDNGASWCDMGPAGLNDPAWGDVCLLTTANCVGSGDQNMVLHGNGQSVRNMELRMYPNPNRGDQLFINLSHVEEGVNTVSLDIYDGFGKRVAARTIAVQDGFVNTVLNLNGELSTGLYIVHITAGSRMHTDRLVIQP